MSSTPTSPGYRLHPPGELSKSGVLDVGLKCTHSCNFCYYSYLDKSDDQFRGMRRAQFRSHEDLEYIIAGLRDNGFDGFDVTGGEPSIHPDIVRLVESAERRHDLRVRLITLGQFLTRASRGLTRDGSRLLDRLLEAGLTNVLFSMHASTDAGFERITRESLARQLEAQDALCERGFQYTTNTVIVHDNVDDIVDIARLAASRGSYMHNFIFMNAYYEWNAGGRAFGRQPRYPELFERVAEAIEILHAANVAVNLRYVPLCAMPGLDRHIVGVVGVRYDPYEWMNSESHAVDFDREASTQRWEIKRGEPQAEFRLSRVDGRIGTIPIVAARGSGGVKTFPQACGVCSAVPLCDGYDPKYIQQHGDLEVTATRGLQAAVSGPLTTARAAYLPAFARKTAPGTDMRRLNARFLNPTPIGPQPRVSCVITNYNYAEWVGGAIASVDGQTYANLQIIVVDDGSVDGSVAAIEAAIKGARRRVEFLRQPNSGQPALARNAGARRAEGELLFFLDADDELAPNYVADAVAFLRRNPALSICYTDLIGSHSGYVAAAPYHLGRLIHQNCLSYFSLMKREAFDDVGGFRDNVRGVEDWDFWIAAGIRGHVAGHLPRAYLRYREKDDGIYAAHVKPQFERKFAQIVLNNAEAYPIDMIERAQMTLGSA